jgi:hypothetical protein
MIKCTHKMSDLSLHCLKCGKPLSEIVKMKTELKIKDLKIKKTRRFDK